VNENPTPSSSTSEPPPAPEAAPSPPRPSGPVGGVPLARPSSGSPSGPVAAPPPAARSGAQNGATVPPAPADRPSKRETVDVVLPPPSDPREPAPSFGEVEPTSPRLDLAALAEHTEEGPTQIRIPSAAPSSGPLPPLHRPTSAAMAAPALPPLVAGPASSVNVPSGPPSIGAIMRQMGEPSREVASPPRRVALPPLPAPSEPTTEFNPAPADAPLPSLFARPVPAVKPPTPSGAVSSGAGPSTPPPAGQALPPLALSSAPAEVASPEAGASAAAGSEPQGQSRVVSPPLRIAPTLPSASTPPGPPGAGEGAQAEARLVSRPPDASQSESRLSLIDGLSAIPASPAGGSRPSITGTGTGTGTPDSSSAPKARMSRPISNAPSPTRLDRYEIVGEIAAGGMATVYLGRLAGVGGFQRFVAIKRLHPHLANEPDFVTMFLDEARLAASIHHPHVVPILEVGTSSAGYYVVMEYIEGDTFGRLLARAASMKKRIPRGIVLRVVLDSLAGLHAAHELRDENDVPVMLVHRDVSPQNILVGTDGNARITDFGVARATSRLASTRSGQLKGKLAYMAPEQAKGEGAVDRRADVFAVGIVLWEALLGKRLFKGETELQTLHRLLFDPIPRITDLDPSLPPAIDEVISRALRRDPNERFESAAEMGEALERAAEVSNTPIASSRHVTQFVNQTVGVDITSQRDAVRLWLQEGGAREVSAMKPAVPSAPPFSTTPPPSSLDIGEARRSSVPPGEDTTRADSSPPPAVHSAPAQAHPSTVAPTEIRDISPAPASKTKPVILVLAAAALFLAGAVAVAALQRGGDHAAASGTVLPVDPPVPPTTATTAATATPTTTETAAVAPTASATAAPTASAAPTAHDVATAATTATTATAAPVAPTAPATTTAAVPTHTATPPAGKKAGGSKAAGKSGDGGTKPPVTADPADEYKHLNPYRQ
jgi:eukaryotic-like serine/threonine-protein kinase